MEEPWAIIVSIILFTTLVWAWKTFNWLWLKPKKLERILREQGLKGNSYRLLIGDMKDFSKMEMETRFKPMNLSDDIVPHVFPYGRQSLTKYGNNCFIWFGPIPKVTLTDPKLIKEVFNKLYIFQKPNANPLVNILVTGLVAHEGEKWNKHRKLIHPAFHLEKLKLMLPKFFKCCNDLISKWEGMLSSNGLCDIDVLPSIQNLTAEVIAQSAFGSSYDEGKRIVELQKEQIILTTELLMQVYIPGWRFLPTTKNRRLKEIDKDIKSTLTDIINKRKKALKLGEANKNDLLGLLLESNRKKSEEGGYNKNEGMSLEDIIDECKIFYIAGQETTTSLLAWTMILLSRYPDWQARARKEVFEVFGNKNPDIDGLNHLKIVTMILYEVLRLYPPIAHLSRTVLQDIKLGNLMLPAGVQVFLPIVWVHHDCELWGEDAKVFNPERFSEGILKATNGKNSYFPFGWGPRICIGQNYSLIEAKMALTIILKHFAFELSPTYAHAPAMLLTLQPQCGVHIVLKKL